MFFSLIKGQFKIHIDYEHAVNYTEDVCSKMINGGQWETKLASSMIGQVLDHAHFYKINTDSEATNFVNVYAHIVPVEKSNSSFANEAFEWSIALFKVHGFTWYEIRQFRDCWKMSYVYDLLQQHQKSANLRNQVLALIYFEGVTIVDVFTKPEYYERISF